MLLMRVIIVIIVIFFGSLQADYNFKVNGDQIVSEDEVLQVLDMVSATSDLRIYDLLMKEGLLDICYKKGYLNADVDVNLINISTPVITIKAGELFYIDSIEIINPNQDQNYQLYSIIKKLLNKPATEDNINALMLSTVRYFSNIGYPFAQSEISYISQTDSNSLTLGINIIKGPLVTIDSLTFKSDKPLRDGFMLKVIGVEPGSIFDQNRINQSLNRINRISYLKTKSNPSEIYYNNSRNCKLVYKIEQSGRNQLEGALGYNPGTETRDGFVFGFLNLSFLNLIGDGKSFFIYWNQPNQNSSELKLTYDYPYPFNTDFLTTFNIAQNKLNNYYLSLSVDAGISYNLSYRNKLNFGFGWSKISASGDNFRSVYNSRLYQAAIGLDWKFTENPAGSITQHELMIRLNYLHKRLYRTKGISPDKNSYDPVRFQFSMKFVNSLTNYLFGSLALHGDGYSEDESLISPSEMIRLGGSKTIRGYSEERFFTPRALWSNLELGFYRDNSLQAYLIYDFAYARLSDIFAEGDQLRYDNEFLYGAGIGFRISSERSGLDFNIAWSKGSRFNEGKLYLIIRNNF